ncbi:MAG: YCF48-related protein [Candidatus Komeilibacteria bacterium]
MKNTFMLAVIFLASMVMGQWPTQFYEVPNPDPEDRNLYSIFCFNMDECHVVGDYGRYMRWDGDEWTVEQHPGNYIGSLTKITFVNDEVGFIAGGSILKTTNGGDTWSLYVTTQVVTDIVFWDENNGIAVGGQGYEHFMLITDDGGQNWIERELPEQVPKLYSVVYVDQTTVLAGGAFKTVIRSADNGQTWSIVNQFAEWPIAGDIRMASEEIGYISITGDPYLLKTIDGGQTWFDIPAPHINGVNGIEVVSETELYSFMENTIYLSENGGQNWLTFSTGIQTSIDEIYPLADHMCWTIGPSGAIYWATEMPLSNDTTVLPMEISLVNYPNPFNPTTTINYTLNYATAVKLIIYDLRGKLITTLINDWQTPGNYSVQWSANDLSNGLYLSYLVTDNQVTTNKMTLLK